ncbi:unnamed protein product [Phaedon cochleariae]|uniref:VWFC domain-containing protein n=1 Tax=Phaedon cochleariae TaxID=80249 RepID=A0A9P0DQV3_PHACE|nr:unnamed protein product [Phaedon cochleariae]
MSRGTTDRVIFGTVVMILWMVSAVEADCKYEEEIHGEGTEVPTAEPCLNCTCSRGVLLCYLRVCTKLPNPPPAGCILLHRYHTCCPELICSDISGGNSLEGRSDPEDELDIPVDRTVLDNACVSNGSIYGPGSAMDSSSNCEYCYCLGGKEICIKPKCLNPIDGCTPNFDPSYCCPIHYNCSNSSILPPTTMSTTTEVSQQEKGGCLVDGIYQKEGGKVLGVGHSACDNCYCLKGLVRCEPLSCAPPLLGCSPVIKPGECCAASYNCSGTIEIQAEPFYGHQPVISKVYSKLHKQAHLKLPAYAEAIVTVSPQYVSSETAHSRQRSPGTFGTTRQFSGINFDSGTTKPYYQDDEKHSRTSTMVPLVTKNIQSATTNYQFQNAVYRRIQSTTKKPKLPVGNLSLRANYKVGYEATHSGESMPDNLFSLFESFLNDKAQDNATTTMLATTLTDNTSEAVTMVSIPEDISTIVPTSVSQESTETNNPTTTEQILSTIKDISPNVITVRTVLKSTDCSQNKQVDSFIKDNSTDFTTPIAVDAYDVNDLIEITGYNDITSTEVNSSETTTEDDDAETLIASATLRNIPELNSQIAAILNTSKQKSSSDEEDIDYGESSLPPSLPNLRIIYFYPEDAVDSKKGTTKENAGFAQDRRQDGNTNFIYNNHFSPPEKTEGGFIPREPPILENYYENAVTPISIDQEAKPNANCVSYDGNLILHGQSVQSDSPCVTCTCFYGNIACQKPSCPIPRSGCRQSTVQDLTLCCPRYICDDEAPTVVLDHIERIQHTQEAVTVAEKLATPDPFRDVIRTEPAPNLQSLIIDMAPHIYRKTTQQYPTTIHSNNPDNTTPQVADEALSFDKVFQFIFPEENRENAIPTTTNFQTMNAGKTDDRTMITSPQPPIESSTNYEEHSRFSEDANHSNGVDSSTGPSLPINLAGCNIYGRMYRVGKLISELSGPCLECKCTDVGVQCKALKC